MPSSEWAVRGPAVLPAALQCCQGMLESHLLPGMACNGCMMLGLPGPTGLKWAFKEQRAIPVLSPAWAEHFSCSRQRRWRGCMYSNSWLAHTAVARSGPCTAGAPAAGLCISETGLSCMWRVVILVTWSVALDERCTSSSRTHRHHSMRRCLVSCVLVGRVALARSRAACDAWLFGFPACCTAARAACKCMIQDKSTGRCSPACIAGRCVEWFREAAPLVQQSCVR